MPTLGDGAEQFDAAFGAPIALSRYREPGLSHGLHLYVLGDRWLYVFFRAGRAAALLCLYVAASPDRDTLEDDAERFVRHGQDGLQGPRWQQALQGLPWQRRTDESCGTDADACVELKRHGWILAADDEARDAAHAGAATRAPWKHWPPSRGRPHPSA